MSYCQHCGSKISDPTAMRDCIAEIQKRLNNMAAERQGTFDEEAVDAVAEILCALRILYNERPKVEG